MTLTTAPLFLAEISAYNTRTQLVETLRYASIGYTTSPSATPASTYYDGRIKQAVDINRTMFSGGTTIGRSTVGIGDLILANDDGLLDDLNNYGFDGRTVTIWRTTTINPSYPSDFTKFVLTMTVPELTSTEVRLKLRDRQQIVASAPLQQTKFAGDNVLPNGLEGTSELTGKPKPIVYGAVKNISPPSVNTSKLIYQVHDAGSATVDAVYDRGISLSIGLAWTKKTSGVGSTNIKAIATDGAGVWVAVGATGTLSRSTDNGLTWNTATSGFSTSSINGVAYGSISGTGYFVIVGDSGKLSTSTDGGATWTSRTSQFGTSNINGVAFGNGTFVAVGAAEKISYSTTATTWTAATPIGGAALFGVAYGTVNNVGRFIAVGAAGTTEYSTDAGATWTHGPKPSGTDINAITFGRDRWVAVGASGVAYTCLDGVNFTVRSTDFDSAAIGGVTYGNGLFVAMAATTANRTDGQGATSPDGVVWTNLPPSFSSLSAIAAGFGNGVFVAVGNGGALSVTTTAGATYANVTDLQDDTKAPAQGTFKYYSGSEGTYFRLGSLPAGTITANVTQGANDAARTAAQLYTLVLQRAGLSSGDWSATDITTLDGVNSAVLGYYSEMNDVKCADVADLIANSVGAWWGVDASGVFRIKQFTAPSGTPDLNLTENDCKGTPERIATNDVGDGIPLWKITKRWGRYYTTLTSDLAGGVDDASRAAFAQEWRDAVASDATVVTAYPTSQELIDETLLTTSSDAASEATRVLTLRSVKRDRYQIVLELNAETNALDIGSVIGLSHPRFGLSVVGDTAYPPTYQGTFRVLDIAPNAAAKELTLSVWGSASGYVNLVDETGAYWIDQNGAYFVSAA